MHGLWMDEPLKGAIMVGVHKRNVSPQNHSQDITLNDHYIYEIICLVDFFFPLDTHILKIKMVATFYDLDD